jgi:ketosteroid isomerase-like protein
MILNSLRINQLSEKATDWYINQYLDAMDKLDIAAYADFLADDVSIQFNNESPVSGKDAVVGMLSGYWQAFASIEHEPLNIYGSDSSFMLEALNHYVRHDGRRVTTHAVALTDRNDQGLATSIRVFADASPVFAE